MTGTRQQGLIAGPTGLGRFFAAAVLFAAPVLLPGQEDTIRDSVGMELKLVRDGSFLMGYAHYRQDLPMIFHQDHAGDLSTDGEQPAHQVTITRPFYLATKEVTVAQFRRFAEDTNYVTTAEESGDGIVGWHNQLNPERRHEKRRFKRAAEYSWKNPGFEQADDHPVVGVSWADANAFCEWLGKKENQTYRLPTEAEWEYACGAGSPEFFGFGDRHRGKLNRVANYGDITLEEAHEGTASGQWFVEGPGDGAIFTSPVGKYDPNAWGFHDMHGNVWELCQDFFNDTFFNQYRNDDNRKPPGRGIDPVNLDQPWNEYGDWRVIKGGSWAVSPFRCRRGVRAVFEKNDGGCYIGFRVARDAEGPLISEAKARHEKHEAARAALEAEESVQWWIAYNEDYSIRLVLSNPPATVAEHLPWVRNVAALEVHGHGHMAGELLPAIGQMKDLRVLRIYDPGDEIPPDAYEVLAGLEKLEELSLSNGTTLTIDTVATFSCLENLRILRLGNDNSGSADVLKLRGRSFSKLKQLDLENLQSNGTELEIFASAPLESLALRTLTDEGARQAGKFRNLKSLRINQPEITGTGLSELAGLSNLESLRLTNLKQLSDADFAPIERMTGLKNLELSGSGAGDRTAEIVARLPRLRLLTIGSPALTDLGMKHIGGISTFDYILEIGPESAITDAGLAQMWAPDRLKMLRLYQPAGLTGRGFASIADEMQGLMHIELRSGDIDDEGLRNLGYLPRLRTLKIHAQSGRGLEDITLKGLLDLAEAPELETVELFGPKLAISETDIAAVKEKLPKLNLSVRN